MKLLRLLLAAAALVMLAACAPEPDAPPPTPSVTPYPFVTATRQPTLAPVYVTATREVAAEATGDAQTDSPDATLDPERPTETPFPTSAIGVCPAQPPGAFSTVLAAMPELISRIGCVLPPDDGGPVQHWPVAVKYQPMQRGHMVWVSRLGWYDGAGVVYALHADGSYTRSDDTYQYASDAPSGGPEPPEGLFQPVENLGKAWRSTPGLADRLGFGTAPEITFEGEMQLYQFGEMVHIAPRGLVAIMTRRNGVTAWQLFSLRSLAAPTLTPTVAPTPTEPPPPEGEGGEAPPAP